MPELTEEEFRSTFGSKMIDITENTEATVDIWPYVEQLGKEKIVSKYVAGQARVELVYRNIESTYDHAFIPTENQNIFLVIVVDLLNEDVLGHFWIDMKKEYFSKE